MSTTHNVFIECALEFIPCNQVLKRNSHNTFVVRSAITIKSSFHTGIRGPSDEVCHESHHQHDGLGLSVLRRSHLVQEFGQIDSLRQRASGHGVKGQRFLLDAILLFVRA